MTSKTPAVKESKEKYETNGVANQGLRKIGRAVRRGRKERSRLYKEIIVKHQKAWEKLANL